MEETEKKTDVGLHGHGHEHGHEYEHGHSHGHCHCCDDDEGHDHGHGHDHEHEHEHEHGHSHGHCHCCDDDEGHDHHHGDGEEEEHSLPKIIIAAGLFIAALLVEHLVKFDGDTDHSRFLIVKAVCLVLYFASYMLTGLGVLREAVGNLFHGKIFGEEFLMALATVGAIALGEYSEAVAVMLLFQIGEFLEDKAVDRSKKSISSLVDIRPDRATVKRNGSTQEVLATEVKVGDTILVKPGERVPLDGTVIGGRTFVDSSAITGESVPREILPGDRVLSGYINRDGVIEVAVEKEFSESTASRILELVQDAQGRKASTERFIKRFARIYTPAVCLLALLLAVLPPLVLTAIGAADVGAGSLWRTWAYRALELLVVSCPCALVISVPLSFFAGLGLASSQGILIKGSNYIEALSRIKTVVFDKTGTLTKGVFEVTAVHPAAPEKIGAEELLALATHAEYYSTHPISRSLKAKHHCPVCERLLISTADGSDAKEISGRGVKTILDGRTVLAGNAAFMREEKVKSIVPCQEQDSGTVIHVAIDGEYAGHIVISDVLKDGSPKAISKLRSLGVEKIVMLTGDEEEASRQTADRLELDDCFSGLLPQDKLTKLDELMAGYAGTNSSVAFVGDGINDAPVLTRSDVGMAMGGIGSDAAIEAADVVIMDDMPERTAHAICIGRQTMANVWQNVCFSLGVKLLIMVLCAVGIANMWLAVFGDTGVTLLAALNSMRLLGKKTSRHAK
ncbi:MAG: heavy metal translocating P-type ATPase [Treponema sp.]|nr:heavy metal translocating P-type ATPase [Treponema sp.]